MSWLPRMEQTVPEIALIYEVLMDNLLWEHIDFGLSFEGVQKLWVADLSFVQNVKEDEEPQQTGFDGTTHSHVCVNTL